MEGDGGVDLGCLLGAFTGGVIFVEVERATGAVDDQDTLVAGGLEDLVHAGGHFGDAVCGAGAPVLVPHIADDDGGLGGVPADLIGERLPMSGVRGGDS